jgi:hypothetical protein
VYVDGVLKQQVDTYSATQQAQAANYTVSGLPYGTHTLTIVVQGARDSASQGSWVWIDAFNYIGTAPSN